MESAPADEAPDTAPAAEPAAARKPSRIEVEETHKEVFLASSLAVYLVAGGWIGWLVFANGVAFHLSVAAKSRWTPLLRAWNASCNIVLAAIVNWLTPFQPLTGGVTAVSVGFWLLNDTFCDRSALMHAFLVQWPLAAVLFLFENADSVAALAATP